LNGVERQSGTKNATILMILAGVFDIHLGYQSYLLPIMIPDPFQTIPGTTMIVLGVLTFCVSLIVWLQKPWVTIIIAGVCVAVCVALVIFGYYLMIIIVAPIHVIAIKQIKRVNEHSEWHED